MEFDLLPSYDDLRRKTDQEIIALYNGNATAGERTRRERASEVGLMLMWLNGSFYLGELARRDTARATSRMEDMTRTIRWLTWVITILTAASVIAAIVVIVAK